MNGVRRVHRSTLSFFTEERAKPTLRPAPQHQSPTTMSSPPRPAAKSRKQTRREALAALKSARASRGAASGLDAVDFDDEEDVFETMDEDQYREYVERRREREDFVVDDGE